MMHSLPALALLLSCVVASGVDRGAASRQTTGGERRATDSRAISVYAGVVDQNGNTVPDLTGDDFVVREDGVAREVLKAEPASGPMQIALLVDDSQAAIDAVPQIREGLQAFIDALQGKAEIALITIGERPTSIVQYTTSADALKKGVNRIFARRGSGAYLLEGITEASKGLERRKATRPVIVALSTEGVEFSNSHYDQVLRDLYASGATLHVLALGTPAPSTTDEMRNRNVVISEGPERTGGRRDQLLSPQAIPDRMKQLAAELGNQYEVTYARPGTLIPPERVRVSARRPGLTVRSNTAAVAGK